MSLECDGKRNGFVWVVMERNWVGWNRGRDRDRVEPPLLGLDGDQEILSLNESQLGGIRWKRMENAEECIGTGWNGKDGWRGADRRRKVLGQSSEQKMKSSSAWKYLKVLKSTWAIM